NSDCASGNGTLSGGDADPGVGQDLADQLDEIGSGLDKTNAVVSEPTPFTPSHRLTASFTSLYDFTTDPDYPTWLHTGDDPKAIIAATFAARLAAGVAEGIRIVAEDACNQVLVVLGEGGNVSAACVPFSVLTSALNSTAELLEFNLNDSAEWD